MPKKAKVEPLRSMAEILDEMEHCIQKAIASMEKLGYSKKEATIIFDRSRECQDILDLVCPPLVHKKMLGAMLKNQCKSQGEDAPTRETKKGVHIICNGMKVTASERTFSASTIGFMALIYPYLFTVVSSYMKEDSPLSIVRRATKKRLREHSIPIEQVSLSTLHPVDFNKKTSEFSVSLFYTKSDGLEGHRTFKIVWKGGTEEELRKKTSSKVDKFLLKIGIIKGA